MSTLVLVVVWAWLKCFPWSPSPCPLQWQLAEGFGIIMVIIRYTSATAVLCMLSAIAVLPNEKSSNMARGPEQLHIVDVLLPSCLMMKDSRQFNNIVWTALCWTPWFGLYSDRAQDIYLSWNHPHYFLDWVHVLLWYSYWDHRKLSYNFCFIVEAVILWWAPVATYWYWWLGGAQLHQPTNGIKNPASKLSSALLQTVWLQQWVGSVVDSASVIHKRKHHQASALQFQCMRHLPCSCCSMGWLDRVCCSSLSSWFKQFISYFSSLCFAQACHSPGNEMFFCLPHVLFSSCMYSCSSCQLYACTSTYSSKTVGNHVIQFECGHIGALSSSCHVWICRTPTWSNLLPVILAGIHCEASKLSFTGLVTKRGGGQIHMMC